MRPKRMILTAVAMAAMAACSGDANAPDDEVDGLGPNLSAPTDPPDTFTGTGTGGGGPTGGYTPATGVAPGCNTGYLLSIVKENPDACSRR
ncbi:MAG TPA: hypothetical protein VFX50_04035 [Gemmatimonadales bacterium]|nr:hypothetical protein [Gemmatimonadales bacterium]